MSQSPNLVGEKTRLVALGRAPRSEVSQSTLGPKPRREIPASYLLKHRCKKCNGEHCVGQCRF